VLDRDQKRESRSGSYPIVIPLVRLDDLAWNACGLKRVPQGNPRATEAAVGGPLIQEIRRSDDAIGDPNVSRVRRVEHLEADLEVVTVGEARVFHD
jgi:hypothetical protein